MKQPLSPFGESARILRVRLGLTLKSMADALGISSAHLSSIEFAEKSLLKKHVDATLEYFAAHNATAEQIEQIKKAANASVGSVKVKLNGANRELVAAFARKLEGGCDVPADIAAWVNSNK